MERQDYLEVERQLTSGFYSKRDVVLVRGFGARVWDIAGKEYIDCVGGHGACNVGHCNPAVVAAVEEQLRKLITCPEGFYNDARARLLARLRCVMPPELGRFFLCNSGAEAVEAAIKIARASTGRAGIVAAKRGFHGRTLGALSATWEKRYKEGFEPLVPGFVHVGFNDVDELAENVRDDTAAVILEVVQGEGGVHVAEPEFVQKAAELCRERGALLIIDEVQTGFGRTGKMFGYEWFGIVPDLVCMAKSIAGGLPMGAVAIGERVGKLPPHGHGSTFGGNPVACAAAYAAIGFIIDNRLADRASTLGDRFVEMLKAIESKVIREVRGLGLMVGVELRYRCAPYLKKLLELGVLALPAGSNVVRFLPPLVISEEELEEVARRFEAALRSADLEQE